MKSEIFNGINYKTDLCQKLYLEESSLGGFLDHRIKIL